MRDTTNTETHVKLLLLGSEMKFGSQICCATTQCLPKGTLHVFCFLFENELRDFVLKRDRKGDTHRYQAHGERLKGRRFSSCLDEQAVEKLRKGTKMMVMARAKLVKDSNERRLPEMK